MLHNHFGMTEGRNTTPWNHFGQNHGFGMGYTHLANIFGHNHQTNAAFDGVGFCTSPRTDIVETKDHYEFNMEVPGYEPSKIDVFFSDSVLTVKGYRTLAQTAIDTKGKENAKFITNERAGMSFVRQFVLPECGSDTKIDATFRNGLLMISVKKSIAKNTVKVKIKTVN